MAADELKGKEVVENAGDSCHEDDEPRDNLDEEARKIIDGATLLTAPCKVHIHQERLNSMVSWVARCLQTIETALLGQQELLGAYGKRLDSLEQGNAGWEHGERFTAPVAGAEGGSSRYAEPFRVTGRSESFGATGRSDGNPDLNAFPLREECAGQAGALQPGGDASAAFQHSAPAASEGTLEDQAVAALAGNHGQSVAASAANNQGHPQIDPEGIGQGLAQQSTRSSTREQTAGNRASADQSNFSPSKMAEGAASCPQAEGPLRRQRSPGMMAEEAGSDLQHVPAEQRSPENLAEGVASHVQHAPVDPRSPAKMPEGAAFDAQHAPADQCSPANMAEGAAFHEQHASVDQSSPANMAEGAAAHAQNALADQRSPAARAEGAAAADQRSPTDMPAEAASHAQHEPAQQRSPSKMAEAAAKMPGGAAPDAQHPKQSIENSLLPMDTQRSPSHEALRLSSRQGDLEGISEDQQIASHSEAMWPAASPSPLGSPGLLGSRSRSPLDGHLRQSLESPLGSRGQSRGSLASRGKLAKKFLDHQENLRRVEDQVRGDVQTLSEVVQGLQHDLSLRIDDLFEKLRGTSKQNIAEASGLQSMRGPGQMGEAPIQREASDNLYISGLPKQIDDDGLKEMFEELECEVVDHKIIADPAGAETSSAMVLLTSKEQASKAIEALNGMPSPGGRGSTLQVEPHAVEPSQLPESEEALSALLSPKSVHSWPPQGGAHSYATSQVGAHSHMPLQGGTHSHGPSQGNSQSHMTAQGGTHSHMPSQGSSQSHMTAQVGVHSDMPLQGGAHSHMPLQGGFNNHLTTQGGPHSHMSPQGGAHSHGPSQGDPHSHMPLQGGAHSHMSSQGGFNSHLTMQGGSHSHMSPQGGAHSHGPSQGEPHSYMMAQGGPHSHMALQGGSHNHMSLQGGAHSHMPTQSGAHSHMPPQDGTHSHASSQRGIHVSVPSQCDAYSYLPSQGSAHSSLPSQGGTHSCVTSCVTSPGLPPRSGALYEPGEMPADSARQGLSEMPADSARQGPSQMPAGSARHGEQATVSPDSPLSAGAPLMSITLDESLFVSKPNLESALEGMRGDMADQLRRLRENFEAVQQNIASKIQSSLAAQAGHAGAPAQSAPNGQLASFVFSPPPGFNCASCGHPVASSQMRWPSPTPKSAHSAFPARSPRSAPSRKGVSSKSADHRHHDKLQQQMALNEAKSIRYLPAAPDFSKFTKSLPGRRELGNESPKKVQVDGNEKNPKRSSMRKHRSLPALTTNSHRVPGVVTIGLDLHEEKLSIFRPKDRMWSNSLAGRPHL